ncbi:MAG: YciI family protein [Bacteroidota bacterium]
MGAELKEKNKLLLAGPTDFELISSNKINPIGHITGIIILNVKSREEADLWAEKDPFHINGYRKNVVHSFKITMTEGSVFQTLQKINNQS